MKSFALDGRLLSVAKFVRQGAMFADVGTDHAYLPLALLKDGVIRGAICSDINRGPLESAMANARAEGLSERIKFFLTDGAAALSGEGIEDLAIAGMGGELIARIIEDAPFLKDENIHLILQPMSKQAHLRRYLASAGFEITDEDYSHSQGKYYVTILARYTGACGEISDVTAEFGEEKFRTGCDECTLGYLNEKKKAFMRASDGKARGGECADYENKIIKYINAFLISEK